MKKKGKIDNNNTHWSWFNTYIHIYVCVCVDIIFFYKKNGIVTQSGINFNGDMLGSWANYNHIFSIMRELLFDKTGLWCKQRGL